MTYRQSIFIGNTFLGATERPDEVVHGQLQAPESVAYFCPQCGEVWARAVVENRPFRVWTISCSRHPTPFRRIQVAGSLLMEWDREFNDSLPHAALQREVILHAEWLEGLLDNARAL